MRVAARRAKTNQPKATPWDFAAMPVVLPFQGDDAQHKRKPRALPWAFMFGPFGAAAMMFGLICEDAPGDDRKQNHPGVASRQLRLIASAGYSVKTWKNRQRGRDVNQPLEAI